MVRACCIDRSCFHMLIRAFLEDTTFYIPSGHSPREHDPMLYSVDDIDAANEEAMTDAFNLLPGKWTKRLVERSEVTLRKSLGCDECDL